MEINKERGEGESRAIVKNLCRYSNRDRKKLGNFKTSFAFYALTYLWFLFNKKNNETENNRDS